MPPTERDYTKLTEVAKRLGFIPSNKDGDYTLDGFDADVDLSACEADEMSILKTAVMQLSEFKDTVKMDALEANFYD